MTDRLGIFAGIVKNLSDKVAETHEVLRFTLSGVRDVAEDIEALKTENARLKQWVSDLQDGTFVNCVYCGHRYGKVGEVPESMSDILKAHIETCPEHPMSRLKAEKEKLLALLKKYERALSCVTIEGLGGTPDLFAPEGFDDWEEWDEYVNGLFEELEAVKGERAIP